jgi:hypothetical protein
MKRFLALLALVLVLMAGMAGMASADTLTFEVGSPELSPGQVKETEYIPPPGSPIAAVTNVNWHDDGGDYKGHLYCNNSVFDNIIYFANPIANPTYVNKFDITGIPWTMVDSSGFTFAPMNIAAFNRDGVQVWSTKVDFLAGGDPPGSDPEFYSIAYNWLTVDVNRPNVSKIIFYGPNPLDLVKYPPYGWNPDGPAFYPSIDNLVINEGAVVPIPASVVLLALGLLRLAGLRKKFNF